MRALYYTLRLMAALYRNRINRKCAAEMEALKHGGEHAESQMQLCLAGM